MESVMIRTIQPTSALPVTRNMPYHSASMPTRNQPRNMTGIYLGLEGNVNPPPNRGFQYMRARTGASHKVRTPAEDRRYKMVELLRVKEEMRGFKGKPLKRRNQTEEQQENTTMPCPHNQQLQHRKWGPAKSANPQRFEDVIKQNPRHYTSVINNGVTRSENLNGMLSFAENFGWDPHNMPLPEALVEEVQRIASAKQDLEGLEECFKKVCKGNAETLHSLLPLRKSSARSESYATGFSVRSYRNPNKAEILADFEDPPVPRGRPKTVPANGTQQSRQPLVPSPYFFKYYNKPGTSHTKKRNSPASSQTFEDMNPAINGERILGLPGSGVISRGLQHKRTSAWADGDNTKPLRASAWGETEGQRIRRGSPRTESPLKDTVQFAPARHENSPASSHQQPLEIRAEGYHLNQTENSDKTSVSDRTSIHDPPNTTRTEGSNSDRPAVNNDRKHDTPGNKSAATKSQNSNNMDGRVHESGDNVIRLDLETEDGRKQEIFLDDKELTKDDESEKLRASEAIVASMQEDASKKRAEFEQILDEHAEIVTSIIRQSSSDSTHEPFQSAEDQRVQ